MADTGDLDAWDDGVIMHEWGHMADDEYGCDDNGGGPHNIDQFLTDLELAWGEAYPDYYQSAIRATRSYTNASFYLDMTAMGTPGISEDLENYDTNKPTLISGNYELAIAAMLWDMNDGNQDARVVAGTPQDPRDRVAHGHRMVQQVYTDPTFESNGDVFDDTCTMWVYLQSWVDMNLPTDAPTAEAVTKNVGPNNPLQNAVASAGALAAEAAAADNHTGAEDPRWWDRVTFIVDNSASMAGVKIDATKTVMTEQINDLAANPDGTQFQLYTFNNTSNQIQPRFLDYFSAAGATSGVNQVSTVGDADPNCYVDGLSMLRQGAEKLTDGQAWLYTDGDGYQSPSVNNIKQLLNRQHVQASVVLLGGCGSAANTEPNLSGAEEAFLGVAANGTQGTGLLPYLMTALSSGGQFLYVANDQMADAAGILRAQLGHSAGAGKWSHYVSDEFTYRWDYLENDEYQWHFPGFGNTSVDVGQMGGAYLDYNLPAAFPFYGTTHNTVRVNEDGVIRFSPCDGDICALFRTDYLNLLDTNLDWSYISPPPALAAGADGEVSAAGVAGIEYGKQLHLFADTAGSNSEWVILTTAGLANYGGGDTGQREYQALLNTETGEIRYQYRYLRNEAAAAQIGLYVFYNVCVFCSPFDLTVSNNDVSGASDGMGYKFTPAPPAPTRPHTVTVDGLATSIVFLLTGYSGDFEPLGIVDPGGTPVSCADTANVKCVTLDHNPGDRNVQYVEVKVNGRVGEWIATVDAGASGQATYSFTGLAAGGPVVDGFYDHLLPSGSASKLLVRLGRATDDNLLTAWLQKPDGSRWGAPFQLFDDGTNGDGKAGDGQFGLPAFTPPGVGVGYLWVSGMAGGVPFQRMEMTPISAQPFLLEATDVQPVPFGDSAATLYFRLTNQAPETHCYFPTVEIPDGWSGTWDFDPPGYLCLGAYASEEHYLTVTPPAVVAAHGGAAGGELKTISVGFQEFYDEMMGDSVDVSMRHQGNPYAMEFDTEYFNHYLRAGTVDTTTVQVRVTDIHGTPVPDGTLVEWSVTGGTLDNEFPTTVNGMARTIYRVAPTAGDVTVNATTFAGTVTASAVIKVADAEPSHITLSATPQNVSAVATSLLVATVTDDWGDPVPNAAVRIGVEADGTKGAVNSAEVFEGLTDASGQLSITFTKVAGAKGNVGVRAELMFDQGTGLEVVNEARLELSLGGVEFGREVFMPFVDR